MISRLVGPAWILLIVSCLYALAACSPLTATTATTAAVSGDPRTTGTVIEDERIERKAADFFNADAEISQSCHLNVTSYNQQVLLTGECPTEQLRAKAAEYAGRVAKVAHIFNEIAVAAPSPLSARTADSLITTKVKSKLLAIKDMPSGNIKVVTEARVVYMMGLIDKGSANTAADTAAGVGGVSKVVKLFQHP